MTNHIKEPEVLGLKKIQENFNYYQERAFPKREPQFFALELAGECGELANLEKKQWRDAQYIVNQERLYDEAADVFIALTNYCNSRNIDLEAAVRKKLEEIEKRRIAGKMGSV